MLVAADAWFRSLRNRASGIQRERTLRQLQIDAVEIGATLQLTS